MFITNRLEVYASSFLENVRFAYPHFMLQNLVNIVYIVQVIAIMRTIFKISIEFIIIQL